MKRILLGALFACAPLFSHGVLAQNLVVPNCSTGTPRIVGYSVEGIVGPDGKGCGKTQDPAPTTNLSNAITTGGIFETIAVADPGRKSIEFQNKCSVAGACASTTDRCWLFFGSGTATAAKSIMLEAGQYYLRSSGAIPSDVVQATCATDGDKFYLAVQ